MELKNKVAVVTGASSGIGEAVARKLAKSGVKVLLTARKAEKLQKLADEINGEIVTADLANDEQAANTLFSAAKDRFGRVDILINNAGMMVQGNVDEIDFGKARTMLRLNTEASIMMAMTFAKHFKTAGSGAIINTSSIAGYKTTAGLAVYDASKAAIEAFTDALRLELAGSGVKVAAVAPGTVATSLYDDWENKDAKDMVFAGGALSAENIADVIYFALTQPDNVLISRMLVVPPKMPA